MENKGDSFLKHFSWYFAGTLIPMVIGFAKTPIFTRHYSTAEFGQLGLVLITASYFTTLLFSSIRSNLWRYYNKFYQANKLYEFYSNVFYFISISTLIVIIFTGLVLTFFDFDDLERKLIILAALFIIQEGILSIYYSSLQIRHQSRKYNILLSTQSLLIFLVLLALAFVFNLDVSAMILAYVIIYTVMFIYVLIDKRKHIGVLLKSWNVNLKRRTQKLLLSYGSYSMIASTMFMLIVSSDRYIVAIYETIEDVGIYTKNYDVAYLSLFSLIPIFQGASSPIVIKALEQSKKTGLIQIKKYISLYFFIFLPITFLAILYSKEIAFILLGETFRVGHIIMPYVFASMFIAGLIQFYETNLNFENKIKKVAKFFSIGLLVNLVLNFLLIPKFGYVAAAISTLLTYVLIGFLFFLETKSNLLSDLLREKRIINVLKLMILFLTLYFLIRINFEFNIWRSIAEIILFVIVYCIFFYKDLNEIRFI